MKYTTACKQAMHTRLSQSPDKYIHIILNATISSLICDCLSNNRPSSYHKLKYFSVQLVAIFNSYHYTMHLTPILDSSAFLRAAFNTV